MKKQKEEAEKRQKKAEIKMKKLEETNLILMKKLSLYEGSKAGVD